MSSTDVFAVFVGVVAESLDDPETTGDDLARRAYLSRFHFDRLVSAVAGESPSRFRRRVLLERAAYRLLTSASPLLDVAVEAGFGSHEAFTRAFVRAYREPPSEWRRRTSRSFFIEARSGVHFHPPAGLRLPARRKVAGMDLLARMVEHHGWLVGELINRAERLDADVLDKPVEMSVESFDDECTIRSLLHRLVWQLEMWLAAVDDQPYDFPEGDAAVPLADLRRRHADAGSRFVSLVNRLAEESRFDETFVDAVCEPPKVFTYGGMIAHVLTFAAYRRAIVICALTAAGVDDLGYGDPMHFVAERSDDA